MLDGRVEIDAETSCIGTFYRPGDYTMVRRASHDPRCASGAACALRDVFSFSSLRQVHSDNVEGTVNSGKSRRLAFVIHVTREWQQEWGGDLIFFAPQVRM